MFAPHRYPFVCFVRDIFAGAPGFSGSMARMGRTGKISAIPPSHQDSPACSGQHPSCGCGGEPDVRLIRFSGTAGMAAHRHCEFRLTAPGRERPKVLPGTAMVIARPGRPRPADRRAGRRCGSRARARPLACTPGHRRCLPPVRGPADRRSRSALGTPGRGAGTNGFGLCPLVPRPLDCGGAA